MSELITPAVMDATWQAVAQAKPHEIRRLQKQCGDTQQELAGFVVAFMADQRDEALGVVLYAYAVITEAFQRTGRKARKLKPGAVMRYWRESAAWVEDLKGKDQEQSLLKVTAEHTAEPVALQYAIDALLEDEDDVALTEGEFWLSLGILKTVVEALHNAHARGKDAI